MNRADCKNYFMSADGRSCDTKCQQPEILKEGKCVTKNECSGDNEIIDETTDPIECKNKTDHGYSCQLESPDGRRCVNWCLLAKQIEKQPSPNYFSYERKCEDCRPHEQFFIIHKENQQIGGCKESISLREAIETFVFYLENADTVQDFEQVKVDIADFISTQFISKPSELIGLLSMFKEFAKQYFSILLKDSLSSVKYNLYCVDSKSNLLVCLQLIDKGKSIQKYFIIDTILRKHPRDLTEINTSNTDPDQSGILLFILRDNPLCTQDSCKKFPVALVENIDLRREGNPTVKGLSLRAIFGKKQLFGQYKCLHYNDNLTEVIDNSLPQIDKITLSCPFDGSTSVEIDETCYFSNSTTFGNAANSRSIRASGKMSVLICVAIYVFIV